MKIKRISHVCVIAACAAMFVLQGAGTAFADQTAVVSGQAPKKSESAAKTGDGAGIGLSSVTVSGAAQDAAGKTGPGAKTYAASTGVITAGGELTRLESQGDLGNPAYSAMLSGASIRMLASTTESQILSMIIQTGDGHVIVVDGGLGADAQKLKAAIVELGGHVDAWLVTHPHGDHVGALYILLSEADAAFAAGETYPVSIDKIYYDFHDLSWYEQNESAELGIEKAIIASFAAHEGLVEKTQAGKEICVGDACVRVLNDAYSLSSDPGNNASVAYMIELSGKKLLILGDMGNAGAKKLLSEAGADALRADLVQMAHHGQNGAGEDFYRAVAPSVCLWPTPVWLWQSTDTKYTIQQTKAWMRDLGVSMHFVTKDGDQTIQ